MLPAVLKEIVPACPAESRGIAAPTRPLGASVGDASRRAHPARERPARRSGRQTQLARQTDHRHEQGLEILAVQPPKLANRSVLREVARRQHPERHVLFPLPRAPPRRKHGRRRIRVDQHVQPSSAAHTARCAARSPSYGTRNAVRSKPSTRWRTWCAKWPPATTPARRAATPARRAATAAIVPVRSGKKSSTSSPSGVGLAYACRIVSSPAQTLGGSARPTRIARRQPVFLEPPDLPRPAPFAALEHSSPRFRRPPIQPQPLAPSPAFTACDVRLPAAPAGWWGTGGLAGSTFYLRVRSEAAHRAFVRAFTPALDAEASTPGGERRRRNRHPRGESGGNGSHDRP